MRYRMKYIGFPVLIVAGVAILTWVVMTLWNHVIPEVFSGARTIDYWHALGLLGLSRILFGGFRGRGGFSSRRWQRLEAMTPEERARFVGRGRCGTTSSNEQSV